MNKNQVLKPCDWCLEIQLEMHNNLISSDHYLSKSSLYTREDIEDESKCCFRDYCLYKDIFDKELSYSEFSNYGRE